MAVEVGSGRPVQDHPPGRLWDPSGCLGHVVTSGLGSVTVVGQRIWFERMLDGVKF
jgi:hypothetical protein